MCETEEIARQLETAKRQHQRAAQNLLLADPDNVPALNAAMTELRQKVQRLQTEMNSAGRREDLAKLAENVIKHAKPLFEQLYTEDKIKLKAVLGALVQRIDLNFEEGLWGNRKVRMVSGGSITLRTTLTAEHRGGGI